MPAAIFGAQAAVIMLNRAFNDISPQALVYANQVNVAGSTQESIHAFAVAFGKSFASLSDSALAHRVLANMGLLPDTDLLLGVIDYLSVNREARGLVVLQIGQILSDQEFATGFMAKYAPVAVAWNNEVTNAYTFSATPTNTEPSNAWSPTDLMAMAAGREAAGALTTAVSAVATATAVATALSAATSVSADALASANNAVNAARDAAAAAITAADQYMVLALQTLTSNSDDNQAATFKTSAIAQLNIANAATAVVESITVTAPPSAMALSPASQLAAYEDWAVEPVGVAVQLVGVEVDFAIN